MYRFMRSMEVKDQKAWDFARKVTAYINELDPDVELRQFTKRFGKRGIIVWMADLEDLNALDAWTQKINTDEGYIKLINEPGEDLFMPGTMCDTVFREF